MGAVVASQILSQAAFLEGRWVQSFPFFGVERRGAPVAAFARIAAAPIEARTNVYEPDIVVVLDPSLLRGTAYLAGLRPGGTVVANAGSPAIPWDGPAYAVDATAIALEEGLGSRSVPLVNTAMVGALAGATGTVALPSVLHAIDLLIPQKKEANRRAAERAFLLVRPAVASVKEVAV
jgi:2-oxoacid:acceptor oxidoreductase gamma subunit (pyruvate/2-ketoisovalerate family)